MNATSYIEQGLNVGTIHRTESREQLTLDGHTDVYPIYEVKVDQLKYNIHNGRIATFISRYRQEDGDLPAQGTAELNDLIERFIEADNPERLKKTRLDIMAKGQQRPAVVLSDGTIIDGNRRFSCLRQIQREDGETKYLKCFILDSQLDPDSLKGLELELQFGQDEKVSYDPISRLVDVYTWCRKGDFDPEVYRAKCGLSESDMASLLGQADLMVEFLEFMNADGQFHIAQDLKLQGPLESLYQRLKKCHDEDKAEDTKVAVFTYCLAGSGDKTRRIRDICDIALSDDGDDFLDEQMEIAQEVLEKLNELPEGKDVDVSFIRETIRSDQEILQHLDASIEKSSKELKNSKVKNNQVKEVAKAKTSLEKVELDLFPKLSKTALEEIRDNVSDIRRLLDIIDDSIGVNLENK